MGYTPPFNLTDEILETVAEVVEALGKISSVENLDRFPRLRRVGRLKSVHSSLSIENNTLTIEQVTDVVGGKRVLGEPNEIQEVKNAFEAYKEIENLDPYSVNDLLKIHAVMMNGLVDRAGAFRSGQVGVFDKDGNVVHMAPPAKNAPSLVAELFDWLKTAKTHPLIKACVFHYEFEFIHPFSDGNGRMGRLWHTVILSKWRPVFAWIPIESIVKERQGEYYDAISLSTKNGNSNPFIVYMLRATLDAVKEIVKDAREHMSRISERVRSLLDVMGDYPMTANEIMSLLGLKSKASFKTNYLQPAIEAGLAELTIPNKPTSKNQRYYKSL
jgi:Fic family protein